MDYVDKLPTAEWPNFTPPRWTNFAPPLTARLAILPEATARELGDFVRASVKPGSRLDSDAFKSYAKLGDTYRHQPVVQGQGKNAEQLMPVVHVLFSNVKTWLNGTYHGVSAKHLPRYVRNGTTASTGANASSTLPISCCTAP